MNPAGGAGQDDATLQDATYAELASTLWHERERLEELLYALSCQHLVLVADGTRWLTRADAQVEDAISAVTESELRRAIATEHLLALLGLPAHASLDDLAASAAEPWDTLLADHRAALQALVAEIGTATSENRRLLHAGSDLARETLARAGGLSQEDDRPR